MLSRGARQQAGHGHKEGRRHPKEQEVERLSPFHTALPQHKVHKTSL